MLDYLFVFLLLLGASFVRRRLLRLSPTSTRTAKVQLVGYLALLAWSIPSLWWGVLRQMDFVYTTSDGISVYALSLDEQDSPPYGFALIATPRYIPAPMFFGAIVAKGYGSAEIREGHAGIEVDFPKYRGKTWRGLLCVKQNEYGLHIATPYPVSEQGCDNLGDKVLLQPMSDIEQ